MKMAMITDAGGLGDKGFNDLIWKGMNKAKDELGFEINAIESTEAAQYGPNISAAAEQGYDIVVCVGFLFIDVLAEVAPKYPDTKFIMIDGEVEGDNVYSFQFDVQQSSYLAGALAGLVLEGDKFGYVGGMEIPVVLAWESGYVSGIKTTNPNAEVMTAYVGSFADPGKAKELALTQFNNGAQACMEVSSGGAVGVAEAARDAGKKFIATDSSKDSLAPGFELTAALCKRDEAVYVAAKMIKEGTAKPGTTHLTLKDGIFGLPDNTEELYGSDVAAKIQKLYDMVLNGEIDVPKTRDEVKAFKYPQI
jgi:basic membrane protein A